MTLKRYCELVTLKHLECKSDDKVEFSLSIGELAEIVAEIRQIESDRDSFCNQLIEARLCNANLARQASKVVERLDARC